MKSLRSLILVLIALAGLAVGALFAFPIMRTDFVTVRINGASLVAELASDPRARMRGLSGREALGENAGMLFLFDRPDRYGIWMKEMKFPIDIFWIKGDMIIDMEEGVSAPSRDTPIGALPVYRPDAAAEMVLETRAGFAERFGIRIGDRILIGEEGARPGDAPEENAAAVPGEEYFIEALRKNPPRGGEFTVRKVLETAAAYQKFLFTYESDGLMLSGVMNVPFGPVPESGFPALILNHGLISPEIYTPGRGSRREQDFFARRGYVTIHPDYRGHAGSSPNPAAHHDFYVGYTRDVLALIDALKRQDQTLVDVGRLGMWGHARGGGIAARAAVLSSDVRAYVLFAPISADVEDNFYELTEAEKGWLHETYGDAGSEAYRRMSPIAHFTRVQAPVQLHHGAADADVPIYFSQKMFETLTRLDKKAELFTYPGEGHEFGEAWQLAADRALQFFDRYVKSAR